MAINKQHIRGAADLERALRDLGNPKTATRIGVAADRGAARALRERLIEAAPYREGSTRRTVTTKAGVVRENDYGHLRDNIRVRRARGSRETAVVFNVTTGNAFWGAFQEFGTVNQPAYPWMRPAFDAAASGLVTVQADGVRTGLEREARKAARLKAKGG